MWKLAWHEAKIKFWSFDDMKGAIFGAMFALLSLFVVYSQTQRIDAINIALSLIVTLSGLLLIFVFGFGLTLLKRRHYVGYLKANISYRNGIAQDCVCVNVDSLENEHYTNLHFRCYGRFSRVWDATTNETIIHNNTHYLSFAPQFNSGKSFEYGDVPNGNNVIYFAKVENGKLVLFTTTTKLISLESGIYNINLVIGGICKELDRCIRPVMFKGRIFFDGTKVRLERRKWFSNRRAAEQSVHLTGGDYAPLQAVSKPRKNPAPRRTQRPPTRK